MILSIVNQKRYNNYYILIFKYTFEVANNKGNNIVIYNSIELILRHNLVIEFASLVTSSSDRSKVIDLSVL